MREYSKPSEALEAAWHTLSRGSERFICVALEKDDLVPLDMCLELQERIEQELRGVNPRASTVGYVVADSYLWRDPGPDLVQEIRLAWIDSLISDYRRQGR